MRYVIMVALTLAGLASGTLPPEVFPIAKSVFPECVTEDSDWCLWDADSQGNKIGESFISINGHVIVFD